MSDDIVITLRQDYNDDWIETEPYTVIYKYKNERHEAAAEIERLRARVAELEYAYSMCLAAVGGVQQDGDPS